MAALAACGIAVTAATPGFAAGASPWVQDTQSAFRLIAGTGKPGDTRLRAGLEIRLQPGWKTYWRYPGDSGVPPRLDFTGSDNFGSARVLYPAPHQFDDGSGTSIGYKGSVILPLQISPRQPGKPVTLRVKLDYAVCEKLCIPAEGRAELTIGGGASPFDAALAAAEASVPIVAAAADIGLTARRVTGGPKPLVMVDLTASTGAPVELFVEGPTGEWALPIPKPAQGAPAGRQHFAFELDGLPPGVDPKARFELTFTVVEQGRALEVKTHLD
ncbi:MAG: protein-disulfide reductase DsbD family protein [Pseudolabrys sp.]|nr:protein-disulfide reductase DsbD family protein [Pseudolabrys sp.]